MDSPPMRSPQAVHSIIARRVVGKSIAEIGTRNGDGMACFARPLRAVNPGCVSLRISQAGLLRGLLLLRAALL